MKSSDTLSVSTHLSHPTTERAPVWSALLELTKPRLSLLSVITALVGYLAAQPERNYLILLNFLVGTALSAGGAAALNQWLERDSDAVMPRTRIRPLPTGQLSPRGALLWGALLSVGGSLQLLFGVNQLAGLLGIATIVSYVAIYTPMKKATRWATEFGAISGALPPLIGWAAAEGHVSGLGWILFAVLAFWQIPHFMAIAWMFREDYRLGGFPMLSVVDQSGDRVARWSMLHATILFATSLLPVVCGYCAWVYGVPAVAFGLWFLFRAWAFTRRENRDQAARKLFFNSIIYLPATLFSLVLDRWLLA